MEMDVFPPILKRVKKQVTELTAEVLYQPQKFFLELIIQNTCGWDAWVA